MLKFVGEGLYREHGGPALVLLPISKGRVILRTNFCRRIIANLYLISFVQVNMPVDSFESPLTLAACGGHYELAALLISRGADLEEVNDEG